MLSVLTLSKEKMTSLLCQQLFLLACIILVNATGEAEKAHQYDASDFDKSINENNQFIMFYAPWCGHCKRLHPVWEQLAEMLNVDYESQVTIAKVDCTTDGDLCSKHDVTGYPTLKFFKKGSTADAVKFRGTRDLPSLTAFINEQLGKSPEQTLDPSTSNGLAELTEENFEAVVGTGNYFVKFYAPWCGHCQKLAPTWEQLAKAFESNSDVTIAKLDCTVHRSICNALEIKGYPTLLFIKDGNVVEKYTGQRTLEDLRTYVNHQLYKNGEAESQTGETVKRNNSAEKNEVEENVPQLTSETFMDGVSKGLTFVKFFAPWCGHCKRLAPTWLELSRKLKNRSDVKIASVDCTQVNSKELCNEQEVEGFPTLYLYRNGEKLSEYNGSRNLDDLYEFLSKYLAHDEL